MSGCLDGAAEHELEPMVDGEQLAVADSGGPVAGELLFFVANQFQSSDPPVPLNFLGVQAQFFRPSERLAAPQAPGTCVTDDGTTTATEPTAKATVGDSLALDQRGGESSLVVDAVDIGDDGGRLYVHYDDAELAPDGSRWDLTLPFAPTAPGSEPTAPRPIVLEDAVRLVERFEPGAPFDLAERVVELPASGPIVFQFRASRDVQTVDVAFADDSGRTITCRSRNDGHLLVPANIARTLSDAGSIQFEAARRSTRHLRDGRALSITTARTFIRSYRRLPTGP